MLRVHVLALENKVNGKIPTHHPLMTWIVPHAAECLTKYLRGADGKTPYERLSGKSIREESYEIGEQVMFRKRKSALKDLESHWMPGTWLGRRWGTYTHIIWNGEKALEAYAVQRLPKENRWDKDILQKITATPWNWNPTDQERMQEVHVIPGTGAQSHDGPRAREDYTVVPNPMHITTNDLEKWGYTSNCRKCMLMRQRRRHHGVRHAPECRERLEQRAREENDPRVMRADARRVA